ncbi:MAG: hypothetical protein ABIH23_26400 [bacterium]
MNIQLDDALLLFAKWAIGRTIRGQRVEAVSLEIDTISQPEHPLRYSLLVHFAENPPKPDATPEATLLHRVFSDVPLSASIVTHNIEELRCRMVGLKPCHEHEWMLSDEHHLYFKSREK